MVVSGAARIGLAPGEATRALCPTESRVSMAPGHTSRPGSGVAVGTIVGRGVGVGEAAGVAVGAPLSCTVPSRHNVISSPLRETR